MFPFTSLAEFEAEVDRLAKQVPVCSRCDKPVAEDFYFEINGEVICAECLDKYFRRKVAVE